MLAAASICRPWATPRSTSWRAIARHHRRQSPAGGCAVPDGTNSTPIKTDGHVPRTVRRVVWFTPAEHTDAVNRAAGRSLAKMVRARVLELRVIPPPALPPAIDLPLTKSEEGRLRQEAGWGYALDDIAHDAHTSTNAAGIVRQLHQLTARVAAERPQLPAAREPGDVTLRPAEVSVDKSTVTTRRLVQVQVYFTPQEAETADQVWPRFSTRGRTWLLSVPVPHRPAVATTPYEARRQISLEPNWKSLCDQIEQRFPTNGLILTALINLDRAMGISPAPKRQPATRLPKAKKEAAAAAA